MLSGDVSKMLTCDTVAVSRTPCGDLLASTWLFCIVNECLIWCPVLGSAFYP